MRICLSFFPYMNDARKTGIYGFPGNMSHVFGASNMICLRCFRPGPTQIGVYSHKRFIVGSKALWSLCLLLYVLPTQNKSCLVLDNT